MTPQRPPRRHLAGMLASAALAGLAACGAEEPPALVTGAPDTSSTAAILAPTAPALDSATLARLGERYPELREAAAPPPLASANARATIPAEQVPDVPQRVLRTVQGEATFYADYFEGRRTASGIPFRQNQMVAAHRGFPFGTILRVTNLRNDRSVQVRVVDRGPWGARAEARNTIIDLSRRAAQQLGYIDAGRTPVRVEVLEWGEGLRSAAG